MSSTPVVVPVEVQGLIRRAKLLLVLLYVGVPLGFFGSVAAVDVLWADQEDDRTFNAPALLVPAGLLLAGCLAARLQWRRTQAWADAGGWIGCVAAVFSAFYAFTMQIGEPFEAPFNLLAYAGVLLLPLGWLLGLAARTTIVMPPVPELADTDYDLVYRLRGGRGIRLLIARERIAVQERVSVPTGDGRRMQWKAAAHRPFDAVESVSEVTLTGAEQLQESLGLQRRLRSSPGPALAVKVPEGLWTLPHDQAGPLADVVRRRVLAATDGVPGRINTDEF
ncbi:MAG TPA: hypothetical protein VEX15_16990 [Nocardioidaceae bacterium]|nr:hypothetical protein [Nocardioidaceae bacterium]